MTHQPLTVVWVHLLNRASHSTQKGPTKTSIDQLLERGCSAHSLRCVRQSPHSNYLAGCVKEAEKFLHASFELIKFRSLLAKPKTDSRKGGLTFSRSHRQTINLFFLLSDTFLLCNVRHLLKCFVVICFVFNLGVKGDGEHALNPSETHQYFHMLRIFLNS